MAEALLFAAVASSALVAGAAIGAVWRPPATFAGVLLAFASGALIAALAFELFRDAYDRGGATRAGIWLLVGATIFIAVDTALDRYVERSERSRREAGRAATGVALLAAVTLDGVPENLALGVSLVEDSGVALLAAIFASNFPESMVGASAMREGGASGKSAVGLWAIAAALLAGAVVAGRGALDGAAETTLASLLAFAGGAVIASLADTLMPKAYESGGPLIAFATTGGFFAGFMLALE